MKKNENTDLTRSNPLTPVSVSTFKINMNEDVTLLDTRHENEFTVGFIPGSIFIGLTGNFTKWAESILSFTKPILLITETGKEEETVMHLVNAGFSNIIGYLSGGFGKWKKAGEKTDMIIDVEADELAMDIPHDQNLRIVDVRSESEYSDGHVKLAINIPLTEMSDLALIAGFEENENLYVHCDDGYRSVIACSLMKSQGLHNIRNVSGGWEKIKEEKSIKIVRDPGKLN